MVAWDGGGLAIFRSDRLFRNLSNTKSEVIAEIIKIQSKAHKDPDGGHGKAENKRQLDSY